MVYSIGIWVSDPYGLYGTIQTIRPSWGVEGFDPSNPGGILAHHIAAGILGNLLGGTSFGMYSLGCLYFLLDGIRGSSLHNDSLRD